MPEILNIDEFCLELKEVFSKDILQKRNFHHLGLFSEQIFGPCKSYTCQCGKYHGAFSQIKTCTVCGVDILNSEERRRRFAKIVLPFPVINPIFYDVIASSNSTIKKNIDALLYNRKSMLYYDPDKNSYDICDDDQVPEGISETWEKTDAIMEIVSMYAKQFIDVGNDKDKVKAQYILDNIDSMIINNVIVLPPELRPASKNAKVPTVDQINKIYQNILTKKEIMLGTNIELNNKDIFYNYFTQIQKDVFELYNYILDKLSKKEGMIRGNILGKRVDFSGRAVISPDPSLEIDYCKLPYLMVLELFKLPIAKKLLELNRFKMINEAIDFVDDCILYKRSILLKICEEVTKDQVCILNRQPSLHRLSMLGFKILITLDDVIKIHPLVCPPYNADFDGDQMAVYIPISKKTTKEIHEKLILSKNFTSPTDGSLTTTPSQDIILGVYALTMDLFPDMQEKVLYKGKTISKNLKIFNDCLPESYKVIDYPLQKKELIWVLDEINQSYPNDVTAKTLDNIKAIGFIYSTLFGSSMSLNRCYVDNAKEVRDEIYKDGDIRTQIERISSKEVEDKIIDKFQYSYLLKSGARGTWDQARQIILSRGFISNSQGHILPYPIKNSLMEGLTPKEFFYSTYGCRKGLLDVADNTAESGHLSRKLIFACANLLVDTEKSDCGVNEDESLKVVVSDKRKAFQLIGKWYYENGIETLITKSNCFDLLGKLIKVRSPIYCKNAKVCTKCYGEMYKKIDSQFAGVIAAQGMGEVNTQLVLRSFHTCICTNQLITDINNNQIKAIDLYEKIQNGEKIYTFSCSPEGDISVSKFINSFKDRLDNKYIKITLDNDKSFSVTLDHRIQLRDGSYVEAQFLKPNDSLMPLYFTHDDKNEYRRVINNKKSSRGQYAKKLVYKLSVNHTDCEKHESCIENDIHDTHHKDFNKLNDYPSNLMKLSVLEHRKKHKKTISESNKRRMLDPIFNKNFRKKLNETWDNEEIRNNASKSVKKVYSDRPGLNLYVSKIPRITEIQMVVDYINENKLEKTSTNYMLSRDLLSNNSGKRYQISFKFAKNNYPELVEGFIDDIIIYSKNYKKVKCVVEKILLEMFNLKLNKTAENFEYINNILYPISKGMLPLNYIIKEYPDILDILDGSIIEDIKIDNAKIIKDRNNRNLKQNYINNPNLGKENNHASKIYQIKLIVDEIILRGLDKTSTNYINIREVLSKKYNKNYNMGYDIAKNNYPELMEDFVDDKVVNLDNKVQKKIKTMVGIIFSKMKSLNLELNSYNFDMINEKIYSSKFGRYSRIKMEKYVPGVLGNIQLNHRVQSIEIVNLKEEEFFYDFEVDSEHHNFPLEAGIFVHNSGVAVIKEEVAGAPKEKLDEMKQNDVINSLSVASKLFHHFENTNCDEIVDKLFEIYNASKAINHVHFEVVVTQMMWANNVLKWRLQPNRKDLVIEFHSVNRIPSDESWLMGLGFSNPKKHIINGLFNVGNYTGIMDKLLTGEKI